MGGKRDQIINESAGVLPNKSRAENTAVVDLGAALYGIGIPKDSIMQYETALKSDEFLVIAPGTTDEVTTAKRILETTGAAYVAAHPRILAP